MELFVTWCFCYGARTSGRRPWGEIRVDLYSKLAIEVLVITAAALRCSKSKLFSTQQVLISDLNPQNKYQDQICQQTRWKRTR